jgi:hypothetical protein
MRKIMYLSAIFSFIMGYSQDQYNFGEGVSRASKFVEIRGISRDVVSNSSSNKVDGSPYLFDDWHIYGEIFSIDNKVYKIQGLNYNAYYDYFLTKTTADSVFIFKQSYIEKAIINNRVFKKFMNQKDGSNHYYEVIAKSEEFELVKRHQKEIRTGITNGLTQQKEPDYLILKESYFLMNEGILTELSLKKKNILKLFGDKSQKVNKFISNNKLSIKEDEDLKKIFEYYDSIL